MGVCTPVSSKRAPGSKSRHPESWAGVLHKLLHHRLHAFPLPRWTDSPPSLPWSSRCELPISPLHHPPLVLAGPPSTVQKQAGRTCFTLLEPAVYLAPAPTHSLLPPIPGDFSRCLWVQALQEIWPLVLLSDWVLGMALFPQREQSLFRTLVAKVTSSLITDSLIL